MGEFPKEQRTAMRQIRVIWAFLLFGQVAAGAVLLSIKLAGNNPVSPGGGAEDWIFALIPTAMLLTLTPLAYFVRNQFYKAHWKGDVVTPSGYVTGNIVLLAMLEGVGMAAIVMMFISNAPVWPGLIAVLAMAVQAINFPTGEPMRPHRPEFVQSEH